MNQNPFKVILSCIFLIYSCVGLAIAQQPVTSLKLLYVSGNDTLPYRLIYPDNYNKGKKYPVILFLHGAGQRGSDNESQLLGVPKALTSAEGRREFSSFIIVPQCIKTDVWVKFPDFPNSLATTVEPTTPAKLALNLLDSLRERLPFDKSRIYVTGYSMGGEGAIDFLTRRPNLFAAAIPICSVSDTSRASVIKNIPIWFFHGTDDNVNDVKYSRLMVAALKEQGGEPKYTEYPGVKHNSWTQAYNEPEIFNWLFLQKK